MPTVTQLLVLRRSRNTHATTTATLAHRGTLPPASPTGGRLRHPNEEGMNARMAAAVNDMLSSGRPKATADAYDPKTLEFEQFSVRQSTLMMSTDTI